MKKIVLFASLLFAVVGCGTTPVPKKVAVREVPVQVIPAPKPKPVPEQNSVLVVPEVDNDLVAPEPIIAPEPEPIIVAPEPVCQCADCGCKDGKACKNGGDVCKCKDCKCVKTPVKAEKDDVPPQKPEPAVAKNTPPAVFTVPPVPAGHVRSYFWKNGVKWYRDTPVMQRQPATGGCPNCTVAPRTNTAGQHSHKCGACGNVFWHVSGSHMCPSCGKGPWYEIYSGSSNSSSQGRAILPWRR